MPVPESKYERVLAHADIKGADECWEWRGERGKKGYGAFRWKVDRRKYETGAHRAVYEVLVGLIPEGLVIDHLCRNPGCVNPAHMEPVTNAENLRRGLAAPGLQRVNATHCPHGHEWTPENTYLRAKTRSCKECNRLIHKPRYKAKKAQRLAS